MVTIFFAHVHVLQKAYMFFTIQSLFSALAAVWSVNATIYFKGKDLLEIIKLILNSDTFVYANVLW
jgi:hypothetical protein